VSLYQGELLPDDRYADWAAEPRERLAWMFVDAALALAQDALAGGQPRAALASVRRILEAGGEEQPFTDGPALLALLQQMVKATPQTTPRDFDTRREEEER
jgi:DNA-binding SARP family transcriptional activator